MGNGFKYCNCNKNKKSGSDLNISEMKNEFIEEDIQNYYEPGKRFMLSRKHE